MFIEETGKRTHTIPDPLFCFLNPGTIQSLLLLI